MSIKSKGRFNITNILFFAVIISYMIVILDITILGRLFYNLQHDIIQPAGSINMIPFQSILEDIRAGDAGIYSNLGGNIILFIPAGFLLYLTRKNKPLYQNLGLIALSSAGIEVIQFITTTGIADIDDIILNTTGGFIGLLICWLVTRFVGEEKAQQNLRLICIAIGIPLMMIFSYVTLVN